jgi:hypothetical protein
MGFKSLQKLNTSKPIYLYNDDAFDWSASIDKHKPPRAVEQPADGEAPPPLTLEEERAELDRAVQRLIGAWRADPSSLSHYVMKEGETPARFYLRALSDEDLLAINDAARAATGDGSNYMARYDYNRQVFTARVACIEARNVFSEEDVHTFGLSPDAEAGVGLIDDLWGRLPLHTQRNLGDAILAMMERGRAKQGK